MSAERLWQVTGPWFCAGLVTRGDEVIDAAPILHKMGMGRSRSAARAVALRRRFTVQHVRAYPSS